jgi:DNA (cytosine-5)-methyltransferase 1
VAISLFSGAGGLDLGAEAAGFKVMAAVESNHDAADTMEKPFFHLHTPVIRRYILSRLSWVNLLACSSWSAG